MTRFLAITSYSQYSGNRPVTDASARAASRTSNAARNRHSGTERIVRILAIIASSRMGGAERSFTDLIAGLGRRGWDVVVACDGA